MKGKRFMKDTTKALLIFSDSYSISVSEHESVEAASLEMKEQYNHRCPSEFIDDFEDMSFCSDDEALLYDNGDNVYAWKVYEA